MSKHVFLNSEVILYESNSERMSKFVKEYEELFGNLDLSNVSRYNKGVGASGYDHHSLFKALIVYAKEGYRSIPQLIRELEAKPYFSTYILGFRSGIPESSTFYRFLKNIDSSLIQTLCAQVNREHMSQTGRMLSVLAIDAKPIVANTKENNPKCFVHNLTDKNKLPARNEESALGFLSSTNDINGKVTRNFYWGYKLHLIVDAETDTPLVWKVEPANTSDNHTAPELYGMLKQYYAANFGTKMIQTADKAYWDRKVFESFMDTCGGQSAIAPNYGNTKKEPNQTPGGVPICEAGKVMECECNWYDRAAKSQRFRFRCPIRNSECSFRKNEAGCSRTINVKDPVPGRIEPFTQLFQDVYYKRQAVERINAHITGVGFDFPNHYSLNSIRNLIGFVLLAKSLSLKQSSVGWLRAA